MIPAAAIADFTPASTVRTCTIVPSSSGRNGLVCAIPVTSRFAPPLEGRPSTSRRVNTVMCGDSTPSVPPDMMKSTRFATSS